MTETTMTELIEYMRTTLADIKYDTRLLETIASTCVRHFEDLGAQLATLQALRPGEDFVALAEVLGALAQLDDIADVLAAPYAAQELDGLAYELEEEDDA
jgi:hypothetical protein